MPPTEILFGGTARMQRLRRQIESAKSTRLPILIQGESGAGKEIIAAFIHSQGPWRNGRFLRVRCHAASSTYFGDELLAQKPRLYPEADGNEAGPEGISPGGTAFLDEIGELDLKQQAQLLDGLQADLTLRLRTHGGTFRRARIICATQQSLRHEVQKGRFRRELFDRIRLVNLTLPSLRERRADIPALAAYFLRSQQGRLRRNVPPLSQQWIRMLQERHWPGNIRELENTMCRYVILGPEAALLADAKRMCDGDLSDARGAQGRPPLSKTA